MKTIKALYGCSYCDFTSESREIVGRHEHICDFNPKIPINNYKSIKNSERQNISNAKSIDELNFMVYNYIEKYYKNSNISDFCKQFNRNTYFCSKFYIENLVLKSRYVYELKNIGISCNISDYPFLNELVIKMNEINKLSSAYNTEFESKLNPELKKFEQADDIKKIGLDINNIKQNIQELHKKSDELITKKQNMKDDFIKKFKDDYNYIDYNLKLNEIKEKLRTN
jgi:hypothetical protein